jgi:hypothetical protein
LNIYCTFEVTRAQQTFAALNMRMVRLLVSAVVSDGFQGAHLGWRWKSGDATNTPIWVNHPNNGWIMGP